MDRLKTVQIMACGLVGAMPFSEPMLEYCKFEPYEATSVKSSTKLIHFHSRKCLWQSPPPKKKKKKKKKKKHTHTHHHHHHHHHHHYWVTVWAYSTPQPNTMNTEVPAPTGGVCHAQDLQKFKNCRGLVNSCVYYVRQTREIYQVLPY